MAEKSFNTRIVHKHDIEANWQLAVNFIPKQGELIVYDIDENYSYQRLKIGDGTSNVNDLPFMNESKNGVIIDFDDSNSGVVNPVNADTLAGKSSDQYVTLDYIKPVLLWENASPSSDFAAQTVNLDLNGYSKIAILCLRGTDIENYIPLSMMEKEKTCIMREISSNGSSLLYRTRSYIFNNTGVTFTKGESISSSGTSTTNNAILIPIKIYGIK